MIVDLFKRCNFEIDQLFLPDIQDFKNLLYIECFAESQKFRIKCS